MAHTCTKLLYHCVFGTKGRRRLITEALRERLFPYISGIVKRLGGDLVACSGTEDHIHLLIELRADTSVAEAMRVVKANSSKWIHETFANQAGFAWQAVATERPAPASPPLATSSGTWRAKKNIIGDNHSRGSTGLCSIDTR